MTPGWLEGGGGISWHPWGDFHSGSSLPKFPFVALYSLRWYHLKNAIPARVHPGSCTWARFSSRYEISQHRVNQEWTSRFHLSVSSACANFINPKFWRHNKPGTRWNAHFSWRVNSIRNQEVIPVRNLQRFEFSNTNKPPPPPPPAPYFPSLRVKRLITRKKEK